MQTYIFRKYGTLYSNAENPDGESEMATDYSIELFPSEIALRLECILQVIFSNLEIKDLKNVRLVCQNWNNEAMTSVCPGYGFKQCGKYWGTIVDDDFYKCLKKTKFPKLFRGFDLYDWEELNENQQKIVQKRGHYLSLLKLGFKGNSTNETFKILFDSLSDWAPNIKELLLHCGHTDSIEQEAYDAHWSSFKPVVPQNFTTKLEKLVAYFIPTDQSLRSTRDFSSYYNVSCSIVSLVCEHSPNLKILELEIPYPFLLLSLITEIKNNSSSLTTLVLKFHVVYDTSIPTWKCFSKTSFKNLHTLNLRYPTMNYSFYEALSNLSNTIRNLTLTESDYAGFGESQYADELGAFVKVVGALLKLEKLTWTQNTTERSYSLVFKDLKTSGIVHTSLQCLELYEHEKYKNNSDEFPLSTMKNSFPNLKVLDIYVERDFSANNLTRQPNDLYENFATISEFVYLKQLTIRLDDSSKAEEILEAISILKHSSSLEHVNVIHFKANGAGHICRRPKVVNLLEFEDTELEYKFRKMIVNLKHLKTIRLEAFQNIFENRFRMDEVLSFAKAEAINLKICCDVISYI